MIIKNSQEIEAALAKLSKTLNKDFHGTPLDIIPINHAANFLIKDLLKRLELDFRLQNLNFEHYENPNKSGEVHITKDLERPIYNRHVILMDGIIISGLTHFYLYNSLKQRLPKSLSIACIGMKPNSLKYELPKCYPLFKFDKEWVEGYGIGSKEHSSKKYLIDLRKP